MNYRFALFALALISIGNAEAANYLQWVKATTPESCALVCNTVNRDAVYNDVAHKAGQAPIYVCSVGDIIGSNHTYSTGAAALCHIQKAGIGTGEKDYTCLCAPK